MCTIPIWFSVNRFGVPPLYIEIFTPAFSIHEKLRTLLKYSVFWVLDLAQLRRWTFIRLFQTNFCPKCPKCPNMSEYRLGSYFRQTQNFRWGEHWFKKYNIHPYNVIPVRMRPIMIIHVSTSEETSPQLRSCVEIKSPSQQACLLPSTYRY